MERKGRKQQSKMYSHKKGYSGKAESSIAFARASASACQKEHWFTYLVMKKRYQMQNYRFYYKLLRTKKDIKHVVLPIVCNLKIYIFQKH